MLKKDIVNKLSNEMDLDKSKIEKILDKTFKYIGDQLTNEEEVSINKFGKFYISKRVERLGRNPRTGETIKIPETITIKFKSSKSLKEKINLKGLN